MNEELIKIREHIERSVTHMAREHGVTNDVVWKQMLLASAEYTRVNQESIYFI